MAPQAPVKTPAQIEAEANARRNEDSEAVLGAAEDGRLAPGDTEGSRQGQNDDGRVIQRDTKVQTPNDIRSQIASRFRRSEAEDERPFNGDFTDAENVMGELGQNLEGDEDDSAEEIAALTGEDVDTVAQRTGAKRTGQQPQKPTTMRENVGAEDDNGDRQITRMVRGKPVTKTLNEWLDDASRVTAADSYLEETRALLRDTKALKAQRSGQPPQHPADGEGAQDELDDDQGDASAQHPEPTFRDVVTKIQFGDPEEAAAELERLVDARAGKKASEGQLERAFDQDLQRSKKQLADFSAANPDLAADEIAAMAIEKGMYDGYREDMLALGLDKDQLPKDPKTLANWHRFYRVNGYEVRPTNQLLEASKERFVKWRDGGQQSSNRQQPSREAKPRVQVNVDRDARRMAIPNQPSRSSAPRRDVQTSAKQTGSDVVNNMRRQRGQPVV